MEQIERKYKWWINFILSFISGLICILLTPYLKKQPIAIYFWIFSIIIFLSTIYQLIIYYRKKS